VNAARGRAALLVAGIACAALWLPRGGAPEPCARPVAAPGRDALAAVVCDGADASIEGAPRLLFGLPLDLNRADARALEVLPGIGPGRAQAIVREREREPFCRIGDLERVRGLGPVLVARIAPFAHVSGAPGCADS
jgi:competence protein ComEA